MAFDYVTDDVIPCLTRPAQPSPVDLPAYRDVVLERFGNPAIRDTNQRVAMDGFSKIPGFIAPTVRERLARGEAIDSVAMLPALFLAFLQRWHRGALPYAYQDQGMDEAVGARDLRRRRSGGRAVRRPHACGATPPAMPRLVEAMRKAERARASASSREPGT